MADPARLTDPWRYGLNDRKTYTKEVSRVQTALFVFHFHVLGHSFGEGDTMLLYKGHRSPLFELPTS